MNLLTTPNQSGRSSSCGGVFQSEKPWVVGSFSPPTTSAPTAPRAHQNRPKTMNGAPQELSRLHTSPYMAVLFCPVPKRGGPTYCHCL